MYIHESEAHKHILRGRVKKGVFLFELKVTLVDTEPEIWRTILVPTNYTLEQLGRVAALAIGWIPRYFHFDHDGQFISGYDPYKFMESDEEEKEEPAQKKAKKNIARNIIISSIFSNKDPAKRTITMDYGSDGWLHEITFVDMKQPDKKFYPKCIDGKNACPPEDCSGPDGYKDILAALSDRKHREHKETKEWLEDSGYKRFNPKKFSVASAAF